MPRKGMLSLFSSSQRRQPRHNDGAPSAAPLSGRRNAFSHTMIDETIAAAETIIAKWNTATSGFAKVNSLFGSDGDDRTEARRFLRAAADLHLSLTAFASPSAESAVLLRAHGLLKAAMSRLEHELHLLLSRHRGLLDPEGSLSTRLRKSTSTLSAAESTDEDYDDDEIVPAGCRSVAVVEDASAVAMEDLRAIAEVMISAGYGLECVRVYKAMRKSIVDEAIFRLGFEHLTPSQVQKLDWSVLEIKVRSWLSAAPVAFRTLFAGERRLCDHVFDGSDVIRESCFADIACDAAVCFLAFPEFVATSKRSPEKLFRLLDLYGVIRNLWPEIESMFSCGCMASVKSQAMSSVFKLADAARNMLTDFEAAIRKDSSKTPVPGGSVHPLTRYVMSYLVFLADYEYALVDILANSPLDASTPLPESFFDDGLTVSAPSSPSSSYFEQCSPRSSYSSGAAPISHRFAWLILVLVCKLDGKADLYKGDVARSYLFLANNLQYVVGNVMNSGLRLLLGDEWVSKHGAKAMKYVRNYERLAWTQLEEAVQAAGAASTIEEARSRMSAFNAAMEATCQAQYDSVVADGSMRLDVRADIANMVLPAYQTFYDRWSSVLRGSSAEVDAAAPAVVRFSPEDVRNRIFGLFDESLTWSRSLRGSAMSSSSRESTHFG